MSPVNQLAVFVAVGSLGFAIGMAIFMLMLILRRRRSEHAALRDQVSGLELSRELLSAIAGADEAEMPVYHGASAKGRLDAVSHLLLLLRGGDRNRLLAISERLGLFDDALARLASRNPARRIDAMRLLEQFASPACVDALMRATANDRDLSVRLEAAGALARMGRLPPLPDLIRMLELDRRTLARVHQALFRSLAARDTDAMIALAGDPAWRRLRPMLIDALGWSENFAVLSTLAIYSGDSDAEVRCAALRAARKLGHPGVAGWVVPLLEDPAESVRIQAAQSCGALGLRAAAPALARLGNDPSWWVRMRAAAAIELFGLSPRDAGA